MALKQYFWYEPKMTSNTAPAPFVASASSEYNTELMAWKAFNGTNLNANDCWANSITNDNTPYLQIDFGKEVASSAVKISARNIDNQNTSPKFFSIKGSKNNSTWTLLGDFESETWSNSESKIFKFKNEEKFRYYRVELVSNFINTKHFVIANLNFGKEEKRLALKNPTTNQHYSLAEKTLIHLPDSSNKNMILYGIEADKEIQLDEEFNKMKFVQDTSEVLGNGRVFTHEIDLSEIIANKLTV